MLITPHALTGATIAVLIPNPVLALPLAVGSHFVLDSIPHWQEIFYPYKVTWKTWVRIPIDAILAGTLVYFITQAHPAQQNLIIFSTLFALLPDVDSIACVWKPSLKVKLFKKFYDWHCKIQRETPSYWGMVTQVLLIILCLLITLR
jgi:hypothetical protein